MIEIFNIFFRYFERPYMLLLLLPLLIILIYFIRKDFVKIYETPDYLRRRKKMKIFVFFTRLFVFVLLTAALASPFVETINTVPGDPNVKILVDNSTSMELFNLKGINTFKSELEKRLPVEMSFISQGEESRLGDGIISNIRKNDNLLLVTDGNNNLGIDLGDAALQANVLNASVSALRIFPDKYDASVAVYGNSKTTAKAENTFTVVVKQTENRTVHLVVEVDGANVLDQTTGSKEITFKRTFDDGYHRIIARIDTNDYFNENNVFYKTVKVVPKPKILLVTSGDELSQLFQPLYDVETVQELNTNLNPYAAVVVDNVNADQLNAHTDELISFVTDGNGLFVAGGGNAYDSGSYAGSKFEQILPVFVAKAGKKRGETNVVFLIDISGSTGIGFEGYTKVDVEKALAIGMIRNVSLVHNVGVVAFNNVAYVVGEMKPLLEHTNLEDRISRLTFLGGTDISEGMKAAIEMLQNKGGSKNIILLSDGITGNKEEVIASVNHASSQGINVYAVGVGGDTDFDFMKRIAGIGNGIYFEPDTSNKIKLIFGDTEVSGDKRVFPLVVLDKNHFITQGVDLNAKIYGFNQIVPKTTSKLLVTTDTGDPILSAWRFGLGRVASLGTDTNVYGFELLNKQNSVILTRTTNWVIGDPERKNNRFVDIEDGRLGAALEVIVKSDVQPSSDELALYKIDDKLYRGTVVVDNVGFGRAMDAIFAVNNKEEYQDVGINPELNNLVFSTGGSLFDPNNIDGIVEFIKQRSRREIISNKSYSWIFLIAALVLYLIEVCIRRMSSHKII